ncbi:MAG: hypothetical protein JWM00_194 [Candidatus Saccharibacteria bacterium]|nr:hypothetical protein [Candidatus Saccharibacteria bacterium]
MSEAISSRRMSPAEGLSHQILALQQSIMPELKKRGRDQSTYAGLGLHAMKDLIGAGEVRVTGATWTEEELQQNATVWVSLTADRSYRLDVRNGVLSDAYDQDEQRVDDEAILHRLRAKLLRKRLAYRVINLKNYILK